MADTVSKSVRSKIMASVRQKGTGPEIKVRSLLHQMKYRFRLHRKELPGTPDIVLPRYKIAIFVHGCFWHQHKGCKFARRPTSNTEYWDKKLDENIERDKKKIRELKRLGWRVLVVWQCQINDEQKLAKRLDNFIQANH